MRQGAYLCVGVDDNVSLVAGVVGVGGVGRGGGRVGGGAPGYYREAGNHVTFTLVTYISVQ